MELFNGLLFNDTTLKLTNPNSEVNFVCIYTDTQTHTETLALDYCL